MNYKTFLIQLILVVAFLLTILQLFTTSITFSDLGHKMLKISNQSFKNNLQLVNFRHSQSSKNTTKLAKVHISKKFAKLAYRKKANSKMRKQKYTILFWGKFYGHQDLDSYCIENEHSMDFCEHKCEYSVDQSDHSLNQSDAIVMHGRDSVSKPPPFRTLDQRWVFLMFESPKNSWIKLSESVFHQHQFNWTMSYRLDSDVVIPYGKFIPVSEIDTEVDTETDTSEDKLAKLPKLVFDPGYLQYNLGFKKLAAWAVSNCQDELVSSERKALVDELSKFMPIDVYGSCGLYQCPGTSSMQCADPAKCFAHLGPRYKFYFALENSLCQDYITEKFFLALEHGMVPIVHGPGKDNYLKHAPPHSFIHVQDYPDLRKLGEYLTHLDGDDEEYLKYFEWREEFELDKVYYFQRAWCNLCKKLHEEGSGTKIKAVSPLKHSSVYNWWFYDKGDNVTKKSVCRDVVVSKDGTFAYQ